MCEVVGKYLGNQIGRCVEVNSDELGHCWGKFLCVRLLMDIIKPLQLGAKVRLRPRGPQTWDSVLDAVKPQMVTHYACSTDYSTLHISECRYPRVVGISISNSKEAILPDNLKKPTGFSNTSSPACSSAHGHIVKELGLKSEAQSTVNRPLSLFDSSPVLGKTDATYEPTNNLKQEKSKGTDNTEAFFSIPSLAFTLWFPGEGLSLGKCRS
ncbi:hypothetical protein TorRG33x02_009950 [Trema orientale]|uniref:Uncharacterized protein n=1 Tax=Trema orientale TaxID=63057 RepID=A0A2P5FYT4_TREOI|nr:hypothetical protein TorRG33x02_009950 [Trema orientale]